jgi:hypothetical protein
LATGNGKLSSQNGNGIEVMRFDSQFFHVLSILKYNFDPFLVSLVMIFVVNYIITLPANRHTPAPGILGFLIMRVPKSDAQRNTTIQLVCKFPRTPSFPSKNG